MRKLYQYVSRRRFVEGYTLTEVAFTMLISSLVVVGMMSATRYLYNQSEKARDLKASDEMIIAIMRSISDNVNQFQIDYEAADSKNAFSDLTEDSLTMAWNNSTILPKDQCRTCPGKFGYTIRPLMGYGGLYIVSVRLTHKDLQSGKPMDYQFIVSGK